MTDESKNYDDIKDPAERERRKLYGRLFYEQAGRLRAEAHSGHVEYGKWLIASLLAVHGGAIFAISGLRDSVKPEQISGLVDAAAWNLLGVFCTLLTGFGAWLNLLFANAVYERWENPALLYTEDASSDVTSRENWLVNATLYGSAIVGVASSLCFVASAVCVIVALKSQ